MTQTVVPRLFGKKPPSPALARLPCPSSPLLGPSEQLTFFCKINHQERGKKKSYNEQNKNVNNFDMGARHLDLSPGGPGWGRPRQPLSSGSASAPRFRRGRKKPAP